MMDDILNGKPTIFEAPYPAVQSGGLVQDSDITSMAQMGFVVQSPYGSTRITFDGSAITNLGGAAQFKTTNSPANGYALRYTNGNFYWAP
jgi:hypothetical protein